jgi:DNA-binding NarL/FixJ family response regulator
MPHRILIFEDEILLAEDLAISLTNLGYEIAGRVSSAGNALQIVEDSKPDLVLIDIKLEGSMA